jgi:hypothetical protein
VGLIMNPAMKYTLGRVGLFVLCAVVLLPVPLNLWVKLMIAVVVSFALQFVILRKWRLEMIGQVDQSMARRRQEKERFRAALAGDDSDGVGVDGNDTRRTGVDGKDAGRTGVDGKDAGRAGVDGKDAGRAAAGSESADREGVDREGADHGGDGTASG